MNSNDAADLISELFYHSDADSIEDDGYDMILLKHESTKFNNSNRNMNSINISSNNNSKIKNRYSKI